MNNTFFAISASVVSVVAFFPYIRAILAGQTRPSGASWWTWTVITMVSVASAWFAGASWQVLVLPAWLCVSQLAVAILSIRYGDNTWDFLNKSCVAAALLGVGLWIITGQPLVALAISIAADVSASIPNFRHAWKNPEQENWLGWFLGWLSAVLEMFTIQVWSLGEAGWAMYFLFNMSATLFLVSRPWLRKLIAR